MSDDIKRYHLQIGTRENGYAAVHEDPTGSWVRYHDVAALVTAIKPEPDLHPTEIPSLTPDQKGILAFAMTMMSSGYPRAILRSWIDEQQQSQRFAAHASASVADRCLCGVEYVSHPDESDVYDFLRNQTEIACPYFREYCQWLAIADICNTSFRSFEAGWRRMLNISRTADADPAPEGNLCRCRHDRAHHNHWITSESRCCAVGCRCECFDFRESASA